MDPERGISPSSQFQSRARVPPAEYARLLAAANADPEQFWAEVARAALRWDAPWERALDWRLPFARWFPGARLNASFNCVDRHAQGSRREKPAILWVGEPGEVRRLTYGQLHQQVSRAANAFLALGVRSGDVVGIYSPLVPETVIAMLACARIGAIHNVVFSGFSPHALAERLQDSRAFLLVTADATYRKGRLIPLKQQADAALALCPTVRHVLVIERAGVDVPMDPHRDKPWARTLQEARDESHPEPVDSNHPLFILYTSGTTGKPKGVVHSTGGYVVAAHATTGWVFDLREDDVYWCTADVGWVTGHTYLVYGPLSNGATVVMYEGAPTHPAPDRWWRIIEQHGVTILYTAPTAIRTFMGLGDEWPARCDLGSLRLLGSVGEPINPDAWRWYHKHIGRERCPIVDTWWQTETGCIILSTLPGAVAAKPGATGPPVPGVEARIVDADGRAVSPGTPGFLVLTKPWPGMLLSLYRDDARYARTYWSQVAGAYFTGDAALADEDGYFWITGRVDDVLKVAGHRLGTAEVEAALGAHPAVAEAAVVGRPDAVRGEAIVAFVRLREGHTASPRLIEDIRATVVKKLGPIARPQEVRVTTELPKTRSGKIVRRLLRDLAVGREIAGDTTTLEDPSVLERLREAVADG